MTRPAALVLLLACAVVAQDRRRPNNGKGPPRPEIVKPQEGERIAWFGTLDGARAEAKRTGRPILFVVGAPHCGPTPGVW